MSKKEGGENNITRPENESSVNSTPLKGYEWKDKEEIFLNDGSKLVLIKNGKNNFGFSYIDENGVYHPSLSHDSGISSPDDKNSPFLLFGNTIMEAGEEIVKEEKEEKEEPSINENSSENKIKISPAVKKIAEAKGLTDEDLQKITGTGKNDNLTKKDIENYLKEKSTSDKKEVGEWKEVSEDTRVTVFEEGEITIKKGSEFYISEFKYVVTSIKEREVGNDEAEYDIECAVTGLNVEENFKSRMDIGELEEAIEEVYVSLGKNKEKLRKSLFTPPKKIQKKKEEKEIVVKKEKPESKNTEKEKEIKINGFTFIAGKTTFKYDGELFRVDEIKKVGDHRMDWILTISKINPVTKEVIEQKEKNGSWLNEIIKDFASNSEINLKEKEGKNRAVDLATKEKREIAESLEKLKNRKTKATTGKNPADPIVKTTDEEAVVSQEKNEESNELADFFSKNLSSSFLKPKNLNKKEGEIKEEQKKPENKVADKNKEWAPDRATDHLPEKKNESVIAENKKITEESSQENKPKENNLSLKEIIEKEKQKVEQVYSEKTKEEKKEKRGNKWRNAWAWTLGLLGLGATAYGVKEYSEKDPNDKNLENESKYQYNLEKEPEGFYYENKKDSSKRKIEEKETKSIFDEILKDQEKNEKIKSSTPIDSTREVSEVEPIKKILPKIDSSKVEIKNIQTPEAPKFLIDAVSIYHPELTAEEKNIVGNSYSKVLEYISGEEDVSSFYKNLSWLNTMGWSIETTLDVSKKVLAGEYGEVGETEKRMAEYFINFTKRQEERGLPANGMNTEAYIIAGLIKDAGIKKE